MRKARVYHLILSPIPNVSETSYWDEDTGRRSISMGTKMTRQEAMENAQELARAERDKLT